MTGAVYGVRSAQQPTCYVHSSLRAQGKSSCGSPPDPILLSGIGGGARRFEAGLDVHHLHRVTGGLRRLLYFPSTRSGDHYITLHESATWRARRSGYDNTTHTKLSTSPSAVPFLTFSTPPPVRPHPHLPPLLGQIYTSRKIDGKIEVPEGLSF